jgi:hypothetical protein
MSIFKGWYEHWKILRDNWNSAVGQGDTVVIAGDVSWAKSLDEALPDFEFISRELNGSKIILKGNHDYWWNTRTKLESFMFSHDMNNIAFLHNNAYRIGNVTVCGTRGWINTRLGEESDLKVVQREAGRLEASILAGLELGGEPAVFLHYPPIYAGNENECILEVLCKYAIKRVFSGHIHQSGMGCALIGERYGINFDMITADYLKFTPCEIL